MSNSDYRFSPEQHEASLRDLLEEILRSQLLDPADYDRLLRRHPKPGGGFFSKSEVIRGFRHLNQQEGWGLEERPILEKLRMKPIRTQSGVAPVTVLTKPYPCPGRCIFCPSDVRMPKSYLSSEPGAQRAAQHQFDPFAQSFSRLTTYHNIGHETDKVELIVLGGTWSSYPESYQRWFIARCFEAMNRHGRSPVDEEPVPPLVDFRDLTRCIDGRSIEESYNQVVRGFLENQGLWEPAAESTSWERLFELQQQNETAAARCVGLVLETRPDHLDLQEALRMRRLGATKIQIGLQSLSDRVLRLNRRGHDVAASRRAMFLLRQAGFKIHAHWMPNLLGSTPAEDVEDFRRIFEDADFRPDEIKIYPCSLVETAELMAYFERGDWQPYPHADLLSVVSACMELTPEYCRVTRVVRDIPGTDIVDGSRVTNLRQVVDQQIRDRGRRCGEIRSREIRHRQVDPDDLVLDRIDYDTSLGREVFLQWITPARRIAAFLRLSLPARAVDIPEIRRSAMVREVHVYGVLASLSQKEGLRSQHLGLGRRLLEEAARIAKVEGYSDLAVISAIGTRPYYRRNGFEDGELYQHRQL